MTKISQLSSIGDSLAIDDQFLIRDVSDATTPNKSVTVSGITRALPDGGAGAPALAFAADKNTGIYRSGTDSLAISTNGTGRLFVDANGQIGVNRTGLTAYGLTVGPAAGQTISLLGLVAGNNTSNSRIDFGDSDATDVGRITYEHNVDAMVFRVNAAERFRVDSSGRLGLGTSSPASLLSLSATNATPPSINIQNVSSGTGDTASISFTMSSVAGAAGALIRAERLGASAQSELSFWTGSASGTNVRALTIDQSQRVGIGSTAPTSNLSFGATDAVISLDTSDGSDTKSISIAGGGGLAQTRGGFAQFYGNEYSGLAGNVTISTGDVADSQLILQGRNSSSIIKFNTGGSTERARLTSDGKWLVGTSSTSSETTLLIQNSSLGTGASTLRLCNGSSGPSNGSNLSTIAFCDAGHTDAARIQVQRDGGTWTSGSSQPTRLVFSTCSDGSASPTERLRITSDAYIRLASGTGGIQFNGDTAAANALDDYEEGTWTPTLQFGGASVGITYGLQRGRYIKIGKLLKLEAQIILTSKGTSTGTATIAIPFAYTAANERYTGTLTRNFNVPSGAGYVQTSTSPSVSFLNDPSATEWTNASFSDNSQLGFNITIITT